jgi:hypothetical protein
MHLLFTCPHCGHQTNVSAQYAGRSGPCAACGLTVTIPPLGGAGPTDIGQDPGMRMLLPVGRSGWAIAAGYAGLFSILWLPAPFALILGIVAVRDIRRHPEKHGMGRAVFGIVMGAVFTLLLLIALAGATIAHLPGP